MKSFPRDVRWLVLVGFCAAGAPGAENAAKPAPALENAAVFDGPGGAKFEPPPGSVAKVHVTPDSATFWKTYAALKSTVKGAKSLAMFAGVPRSDGDEKYWPEKKKQALFQADGQWFQRAAQPVPDDVAEKLRTAVFEGVREWRGMKLCGGFHADVLLKWRDGPLMAETEVLICFGCQEMKIYGAAGSLYTDLSNDQAKELRTLLDPYFREKGGSGDLPAPPPPRF